MKNKTLYRWSYSLHFFAGLMSFYRVFRIASGEEVKGNLGPFHGIPSTINAALLIIAGLILVQYPFRRKSGLEWKDIFIMMGLLLSTEIIPAILSTFI